MKTGTICAVDLFCGGGGASEGIRTVSGISPAVAVDWNVEAIAMHTANHPDTLHFCESVFGVEPFRPQGRPLDWLWASPDCTHFSRARGNKPRSKEIRALAWVVVDWARAVRPTVIGLENVPEFVTWGPLNDDGQPDPARAGETFREFVGALEQIGYRVEWRELVAADFGAPTTRRRLFMVARCDGRPIAWPDPTHGPGRSTPWRTAAECIDWSIPCPSIFTRARPLAPKTEARIAEGLRRYLLDDPNPFLAPVGAAGTVTAQGSQGALVAAFLAKHYGGVVGHRVDRPLGAITSQDHHSLVVAHLSKFYGTSTGASLDAPAPTITGQVSGGDEAHVAAFLLKYYGTGTGQTLREPLHTIVQKARFGRVTVVIGGQEYAVVDIGMRMLDPRELSRAQGFPDAYVLTGTKTSQIARIGNSVPPPVVEAVIRAQFPAY